MGQITHEYASMNDSILRQEWHRSLSHQVVTWKERARDAIGASASIGIAVGGAAATAAGAAIAVAQGIVQGASSAASGSNGQAAIMPPPQPDSSWHRPPAIRRSNSTGDLESASEPCPKCDLGLKQAHTYRGS